MDLVKIHIHDLVDVPKPLSIDVKIPKRYRWQKDFSRAFADGVAKGVSTTLNVLRVPKRGEKATPQGEQSAVEEAINAQWLAREWLMEHPTFHSARRTDVKRLCAAIDRLLDEIEIVPEYVEPDITELPDDELPGMWSRSDFTGGDPDPHSYAQRQRDDVEDVQEFDRLRDKAEGWQAKSPFEIANLFWRAGVRRGRGY